MSFILRTATLSLFFINAAFAAVNINTADNSGLEKFNGVGPATAQKIIDYRTTNGDFTSCDQLTSVKGIGVATLAKMKPECTIKAQ
jgi:competence protein ComEA